MEELDEEQMMALLASPSPHPSRRPPSSRKRPASSTLLSPSDRIAKSLGSAHLPSASGAPPSDAVLTEASAAPAAPAAASSSTTAICQRVPDSSPACPTVVRGPSLRQPAGRQALSVEVGPVGGTSSDVPPAELSLSGLAGLTSLDSNGALASTTQLSLPSLSAAPLSALLSAAGFGAGFGSFSNSFAQPNMMATSQLLGLSPLSVQGFVGDSAALLEEALTTPLSKQLSACRRSPRFPSTAA